MDGIHDLGGMHGFGSVDVDPAAFHADWERMVFAISRLLAVQDARGGHEFRHAIERIDPADYLALPYFGRWLLATQHLCEEKGLIEVGAVEQRMAAIHAGEYDLPERVDPDLVRRARDRFETPYFTRIEEGPDPSFSAGDSVIVKNRHPSGYTRAPGYIRRAEGVVRKLHGAFHLPDAAIRGEERVEPVYSVEFTHRELWGKEYPDSDTLCIDLFESYVRAAGEEGK